MPHLSQILKAFNKPAQRNGPPLREVLLKAAWFTAKEAALGFAIGTTLGLILAVIFVHSDLLQRGLMPFVIGSQTVPILAIAPMIVIWAAKADISVLGVPIIAAYLAFFPVTIYALRGLADVPQTALELMESYAASRWEILLKLRFPNAVPYIFTALKITAPASVVGAVIGELPAGIQDGLGGAILNYAQYYTSNPPQLWATNIITALVGIFFFVIIAVTEQAVVRWKVDTST
jgi:NitT/TauT family transport system permease protein